MVDHVHVHVLCDDYDRTRSQSSRGRCFLCVGVAEVAAFHEEEEEEDSHVLVHVPFHVEDFEVVHVHGHVEVTWVVSLSHVEEV